MDWLFETTEQFSNEQAAAVYRGLSASRKARIDRLKKPEDKRRSLLATALVNQLLTTHNETGAKLENDESGRPFLHGSALFVSISHADSGVACTVSERMVGIDVERVHPIRHALVERTCLPIERSYVYGEAEPDGDTLTDPQALTRFFEVWTAKEAYFKKYAPTNMLATNTLSLAKTHTRIGEYLITVI